MLDLQSTVHFSSVCFLGRSLVYTSSEYRDLVTFARDVVVALCKLGVAGAHSVADLHAALRAERCTSCNDYGAFLFLPTAQRCCWDCLCHNPQLRLLSLEDAERFFVLSERSVEQLPKVHVIPGRYGLSKKPAPENCILTSAAAARALGIQEHGSRDKLAAALSKKYSSSADTSVRLLGEFYQSKPRRVARGEDNFYLGTLDDNPSDAFFGMASLPFPSLLSPGHAESGLWCKGCGITLRKHMDMELSNDVLARTVPAGAYPMLFLIGVQKRAYLREAFLLHIRHCYGAVRMVLDMPGVREYLS